MFRLASSKLIKTPTNTRSINRHFTSAIVRRNNMNMTMLQSTTTIPNHFNIVVRQQQQQNQPNQKQLFFSTMNLIKDLRTKSGAPIMECKKALKESNNDINLAMDWLRKHGAAKASSKVSDRDANEGLVACNVSSDGQYASLVHVSSETDFAGKSTTFINLVNNIANATLNDTTITAGIIPKETLLELKTTTTTSDDNENKEESSTIKTLLEEAIVSIRENIGLTKAIRLECTTNNNNSVLVGYVHGRVNGTNAGSAASIVEIATTIEGTDDSIDTTTMQEVGKKLAMHIVAAKPQYLNPQSVPEEAVEKERNILESQLSDEKKPKEIIDKIITGRLRKFYEGICLTEQEHMIEEGNPKISKLLKELGLQIQQFHSVSI